MKKKPYHVLEIPTMNPSYHNKEAITFTRDPDYEPRFFLIFPNVTAMLQARLPRCAWVLFVFTIAGRDVERALITSVF